MKAPKQIRKRMLNWENTKNSIATLQTEEKMYRDKMLPDFESYEDDEFIVDDGEEELLSAKTYKSKKLVYDFDKLKQKLEPEKLNMIIDKIMFVDQIELKKLLKAHPELRNVLKKIIVSESLLNEGKLELMYQKRIITPKDIKGCYKVNETTNVRLQRKKR